MQPVAYFEIPCNDPEKVGAFFRNVFDWQINPWSAIPGFDYWVVQTTEEGGQGINGGLMRRNDPGQPMVNTIMVPNLDDYIGRVEGAGGAIVVPKMEVPGVGWICYFKDPEANIFGMWQPAEK